MSIMVFDLALSSHSKMVLPIGISNRSLPRAWSSLSPLRNVLALFAASVEDLLSPKSKPAPIHHALQWKDDYSQLHQKNP
jgi:hypothetical protein